MNRTLSIHFAILIGLSLLVGCGQNDEARLEDLENPSEDPIAITSAFPAVVKVVLPRGIGMCTGTFISPRVVLTAAHCTQDEGTYRIYSSFGTFLTSHTENMTEGELGDPHDLALLVLNVDAADPAQGQVYNLGQEPELLDRVRLVGFGCNDKDTRRGSGRKRTGENQLWRKSEFLEIATPLNTVAQSKIKGILGPENRAGACFGDSGGPMLATRGDNLEVVGVSHSGQWSDTLAVSRYSKVADWNNWRFIQALDNELNLGVYEACLANAANPNSSCDYQPAHLQLFSLFQRLWAGIVSFFTSL